MCDVCSSGSGSYVLCIVCCPRCPAVLVQLLPVILSGYQCKMLYVAKLNEMLAMLV